MARESAARSTRTKAGGLGLTVVPANGTKEATTKIGRTTVPSVALQFAACRSLGHEWKHMGRVLPYDEGVSAPLSMGAGTVGFRSRCQECGTHRVKWIGRNGTLGPTTYKHPDGYSLTGESRLDNTTWRKTFYVTALDR